MDASIFAPHVIFTSRDPENLPGGLTAWDSLRNLAFLWNSFQVHNFLCIKNTRLRKLTGGECRVHHPWPGPQFMIISIFEPSRGIGRCPAGQCPLASRVAKGLVKEEIFWRKNPWEWVAWEMKTRPTIAHFLSEDVVSESTIRTYRRGSPHGKPPRVQGAVICILATQDSCAIRSPAFFIYAWLRTWLIRDSSTDNPCNGLIGL